MAADLGVDRSQIAGLTVRPGSVVVTFELLPAGDADRFEPATLDTLVATVRTHTTRGELQCSPLERRLFAVVGYSNLKGTAQSAQRSMLPAGGSAVRCERPAGAKALALHRLSRRGPLDTSHSHTHSLPPPPPPSLAWRHTGNVREPDHSDGAGLRHGDVGGDYSSAAAGRRQQPAAVRRRLARAKQGVSPTTAVAQWSRQPNERCHLHSAHTRILQRQGHFSTRRHPLTAPQRQQRCARLGSKASRGLHY